ncbi:MAG TPA: class I SAM-dependent methyltransferase [Stellaceae bacterium]|nr:class I SAM-dependent methyltransferase [Stellaceae bacterium]
MSGFSLEWLRLRAPFDRAARDEGLARRFAAALRRPTDRPLRLVDLGTGTGANARVLAPIIGGDQDWLLLDDDRALLGWCAAEQIAWAAREGYRAEKEGEAVVIRSAGSRWRFAARPADLAGGLGQALAEPYDGITMAAFVDLVSAGWVDGLATLLERRRVPLLSPLVVDGRRQWHPAVEQDGPVRDAFAAHQRRDKGFGPALGAAAPVYLGARLAAAGYAVAAATSDWRVGPDHRRMLAAVIDAEVIAAAEARPDLAPVIAAWSAERQAELAAGVLSLVIGHRDLLAVGR